MTVSYTKGSNLILLGKILIDEGFCSEAEVQLAHQEQLMGDNRKLGIILVEMGVLKRTQLVYCLAKQKHGDKFKRKASTVEADAVLLGRILIDNKFCSLREIQQAHHSQLLGDNRKLGEILIDNQSLTYDNLKKALEQQAQLKKKISRSRRFKKAS